MTYHSEFGQDRWLAEGIFRDKRGGVYVEFGALDGILHSNSLYFEREMGWTGLLLEANPWAFRELVNNRPLAQCRNRAVFDHNGVVEFECVPGPLYGWSGVVETIEPEHRKRIDAFEEIGTVRITVPCVTLDHALYSARLTHIDYLSIDVEGAETRILKAFPFDKYDIDVIGVEDNFGNPKLAEILTKAGYKHLARVGVDEFFQKTCA